MSKFYVYFLLITLPLLKVNHDPSPIKYISVLIRFTYTIIFTLLLCLLNLNQEAVIVKFLG